MAESFAGVWWRLSALLTALSPSRRMHRQGRVAVWFALRPRRFTAASFLFAAGAAICMFGCAQQWFALLLLAGCLIMPWFRLPGSWWAILLVAAGYAYAWWRTPVPAADDISHFCGKPVKLVGVVARTPVIKRNRLVFQVHVSALTEGRELADHRRSGRTVSGDASAIKTSGCLLVVLSGKEIAPRRSHTASEILAEHPANNCLASIDAGSQVAISCVPYKPRPPAHPYDIDFSQLLSRQGVFAQCRVSVGSVQHTPVASHSLNCFNMPMACLNFHVLNAGERAVSHIRNRIIQKHQEAVGVENGLLLSSMVLGDRAVSLPERLKEQFRASGLSHVLAASGYNLTLVVVMLSFVGRVLCLNSSAQRFFCLSGISLFVLFAGAAPSVLRAAMMCAIIVWCRASYRRLYMPAVLAASLLFAVLYDPASLRDIGLQLSYIATAAMIFAGDLLRIRTLTSPVSKVAEIAASTLLAQLAVLPLQLFYFFETSLYFLPANIVAAALVPVISTVGFASSICLLLACLVPQLETLSYLLDALTIIPLIVLSGLVQFVRALPGSVVALGPPNVYSLSAFYITLSTLFWYRHVRFAARKWLLAAFMLSCVFLVIRPPLEREIRIKSGRNRIVIRTDRTATCSGNAQDPKVQRIIAFYGARLHEGNSSGKGTESSCRLNTMMSR